MKAGKPDIENAVVCYDHTLPSKTSTYVCYFWYCLQLQLV